MFLGFYHFNGYKKNLKDIESGKILVGDNIFVLATLYKEPKEDIEQMINSLSEDNYKNMCVMLVLDGEYCVDVLFNEVFHISQDAIQYSTNLDGNNVRYLFHTWKGIQYLIVIKSINAGKKHSQCIFYDMINIHHNPPAYPEHPLLPLVEYVDNSIDISTYKYVLLLDGDTIIENNQTIEKNDSYNEYAFKLYGNLWNYACIESQYKSDYDEPNL